MAREQVVIDSTPGWASHEDADAGDDEDANRRARDGDGRWYFDATEEDDLVGRRERRFWRGDAPRGACRRVFVWNATTLGAYLWQRRVGEDASNVETRRRGR